MPSSTEIEAIDNLTTMLQGRLDTLNTNVSSVNTTLIATNTALATINTTLGTIKTALDNIETKLIALGIDIDQFVTAFGAIGTNDPVVDNVQAVTGDIDSIKSDINVIKSDFDAIKANFDILTTAFGVVAAQTLAQNVQDIRDDTREGIEMSIQQLQSSGLTLKVNRPVRRP
jgi:septation ring formation regulator EzrA